MTGTIRRTQGLRVSLATLAGLLLIAAAAAGQTSGIAGVVKDTSGAVLPGVTVEATSPALIEKVRTVVTDDQGQYKIVDVRPGIYAVTFTLPGFSAVKREGIELTANFTAPVNVELKVGGLAETVTVSGQSPTVDVQNVTQQKTLSRALLETMPTSKSFLGFLAMTPAAVSPPNAQDVGGSKGDLSVRMAVHGGKVNDQRLLYDGMLYNSVAQGGTGRIFYMNSGAAEEVVIGLAAGGAAEYETGGVYANLVPKDGGNIFNGSFFTTYTGDKLQSGNLTADLQARGLRVVNGVHNIYDITGAVGGPIRRDKLWFYTSHRRNGSSLRVANLFFNATQDTFTFTPDLNRPAYEVGSGQSHNIRFTWQASQKHKVTASWVYQRNCACQQFLSAGGVAREALALSVQRPHLGQVTWTYPATNKLLFEAGTTVMLNRFTGPSPGLNEGRPGAFDDISVLELSNNFRYKAPSTANSVNRSDQTNERVSLSYVTGSHHFKAGLFYEFGLEDSRRWFNKDAVNYTFLNGVPTQLTQFVSPIEPRQILSPNLGLYAQDQWTIKRLTLNLGLRFDYLHAYVPAFPQDAGLFVPARTFDKVDCVPCWKDVNPRLGVAYDLFGTGKTALKVSLGRFVASETTNIAIASNPVNTTVNSVSRAWTDTNRNFVPDCDLRSPAANGECGPMSDAAFGQVKITTRFDPATINGWGARGFNWQASASLEHELLPGVAVNTSYYRTWYGNLGLQQGNFMVTDNLAVTPADFDPYCITAPVDARLPGGGGNQICGLYDINPLKFGQVNNLVTFGSNYGKQTEIYNGVDFNASARLPRGAQVSGGVNIGDLVSQSFGPQGLSGSATNNCFVVDSPQQLRFCDVRPPYRPQFKMIGSYPLPWDLQVSAVLQNLPGVAIAATYPVPTAQIAPSLGRNLAGGARTASVELIAPVSQFEGRINQLDVRLTKIFRVGRARIRGMFDLYNVLNASPILSLITTYGPRWLEPQQILDGRLVKFGAQVDF